MHLKKGNIPKSWPVPRKGKKFVAVSSHSFRNSINLLYILRDILKVARTRREAKYITLKGYVKVNYKVRKDEKFPVQLFDVIQIEKIGAIYRLESEKEKFYLKKISPSEAQYKVVKVTGKKVLPKSVVQMNLSDGSNFIFSQPFSVGDSVKVNLKENKVEKLIPLKKGCSVEVISGKHKGKRGELIETKKLSRSTEYIVKLGDEKVTLPFKSIMVIE